MRRLYSASLVAAAVTLLSSVSAAQAAMDASKGVVGGGISVKGWKGKIDAKSMITKRYTLENSRKAVQDTADRTIVSGVIEFA